MKTEPMNIGIEQPARDAVAGSLERLLADTYVLYVKTQNFHWNVTGPQFQALHDLFEQQYQELAGGTDTLAERIRALGRPAPGSLRAFGELARLSEANGEANADAMLRSLLADQETVARAIRDALPVAQEAADEGTVDLLSERLGAHEKHAWMLRASLPA